MEEKFGVSLIHEAEQGDLGLHFKISVMMFSTVCVFRALEWASRGPLLLKVNSIFW